MLKVKEKQLKISQNIIMLALKQTQGCQISLTLTSTPPKPRQMTNEEEGT